LNGWIRHIDARYDGAAFGKPGQIDGGSAPHFEHRLATITVEVDEPQQMMQLFKVILIEVLEESARPNGMLRDLEIVDVPLPVGAHFVDGCHADNNIAGAASSP